MTSAGQETVEAGRDRSDPFEPPRASAPESFDSDRDNPDRNTASARRLKSIIAGGLVLAILVAAASIKVIWVMSPSAGVAVSAYGILVLLYFGSRIVLALRYRPSCELPAMAGAESLPTIAVVVPTFNEGPGVAATCGHLMAADYPPHLLSIVIIDDGSTDDTAACIQDFIASLADGDRSRLTVVSFPSNRGKRAAMAAGIKITSSDVLVFVDSDSAIESDALRRIVAPFEDASIGAVCGHAEVANVDTSWLTKMQTVRYFAAFRVSKAAESVFGSVTCCSGCFSAYRRSIVEAHLEWWESQTFLGAPSMLGDDRSLTNRVLRSSKVVYQSNAIVRTSVPTGLKTFLRQQIRWKRSWTRETLITLRIIWRHPLPASIATVAGVVITLISPLVAGYSMVVGPLEGRSPMVYLVGLAAMAVAYGLFYLSARPDSGNTWLYGIAFVGVYTTLIVWQTYYAILTARRGTWGTRSPGFAALAFPVHRNVESGSRLGRRAATALAAVSFVVALAVSGALADTAGASGSVSRIAIRDVLPSGDRVAVVRWKARLGERASRARVRVWRDRSMIGSFPVRESAVRIRTVPGVLYSVRVELVGRRGRVIAEGRGVQYLAPLHPPAEPTGLTARIVSDRSIEVAWVPSLPGSRPVVAYRVARDGRTLGQFRGSSALLSRLSSAREYEVSVRAVDSRGLVGRQSSIRVRTVHRAPSQPSGVELVERTPTSISLRWKPSIEGTVPIAGYRVYRNGRMVKTVRTPSITVSGLESGRTYGFAVASVDTRSYLSSLSETLTASTEPPLQSEGSMRAFLLASVDSSFADFRRNYMQIGTIYPTYFDCARTGVGLVGSDDQRITSWATARGVRVFPRINCQSTQVLHELLNDPETRESMLQAIVSTAAREGYSGVNLDFEAGLATDRNAYSAFVEELAARLHADGRDLSIDVSAKVRDVPNHPRSSFFDYKQLSLYADELLVMAWGNHWAGSQPGGTHDLGWWLDVLNYVAAQPIAWKFRMLLPAYSRDWPNGGGPSNPGEAIDWTEAISRAGRFGASPTLDPIVGELFYGYVNAGVRHDVWMVDSSVMLDRLTRAKSSGLDVAFWRLGQEDPSFWEKLATLER